jgi:4-amino-4-deoxy-L-arabinose transferase-like glycosyltransferase
MAYQLTPARNRKFLLVLWLFLYASFTLLVPPLLDGPDARNAEVAREMIARHDLVTLHANGIPLLDTAPMLYWAIAASMYVFGIGTTPAHFAMASFALLLFLMTEHFARHAFRSVRTGAYASILLLLSFGTFVFTRILIPEPIECLWLMAALYSFWLTEQQGDRPGYLQAMGFAAACALNTLTVGVTGLTLPLAIVLFYLLFTRGFLGTLRRLCQLHLITALITFLLFASPWYFLNHVSMPNVRAWAYLKSHLQLSHGSMPLLLLWALLLLWMMPWGVFLFKAVGAAPWRVLYSHSFACQINAEQKALFLLCIAALLSLVLCAFNPGHVYSALPAMPFLAMLIGRWLDREATEVEAESVPPTLGNAGQRISTVLLALGSVVALAWLLLPMRAYAAFFSRVLGWHAVPMDDLHGPLQLMAVTLFGGTLAMWWLRRNYRPHDANIALGIAIVVFLTATHKGLQALTPVLSSQRLAQTMQQKLKPDDLIVINGNYDAASSLAFYLKRENVHIWHGDTANVPSRLVENDQTMRMRWHGVQRIYVWTETGVLPSLPGKVYVIAESGSKQIVSNRDTVY